MADNLIFLDVCNPSFFQGFAGYTLIAFVDGSTTFEDLKDQLRQDARAQSEQVISEQDLEDSLAELQGTQPDDRIVFPDLERIDDLEPSEAEEFEIVAYFGVVNSDGDDA